jgi:hypothetical protein
MDCLGSDHVVPQRRCDATMKAVLCVIRAAAVYRDSQNNRGSSKRMGTSRAEFSAEQERVYKDENGAYP